MGLLVLLAFEGRGGGGGVGGVVQNRESPDFRSPEVGRYESYTYTDHADSLCGKFMYVCWI